MTDVTIRLRYGAFVEIEAGRWQPTMGPVPSTIDSTARGWFVRVEGAWGWTGPFSTPEDALTAIGGPTT